MGDPKQRDWQCYLSVFHCAIPALAMFPAQLHVDVGDGRAPREGLIQYAVPPLHISSCPSG